MERFRDAEDNLSDEKKLDEDERVKRRDEIRAKAYARRDALRERRAEQREPKSDEPS